MADESPRIISRRALLKGAGAVGAAVTAGVSPVSATPGTAAAASTGQAAAGSMPREVYEHLTAEEADLLEAIADQLIPADEHGPGAIEARAVSYIDRALGARCRVRATRIVRGSRRLTGIAGRHAAARSGRWRTPTRSLP